MRSDSTTHKGRLRQLTLLATALAASLAMLFSIASSASAITFGMMWSGDSVRDSSEMNVIRHSGASIYHFGMPLTETKGGTDWSAFDPVFKSAWENGITISPGLSLGARFIGPSDSRWSEWAAWVKAAVKRYGPGGDFWSGKSNPLPVTSWEVSNEPNLPENNPQLTEAQCKNGSWKIFKKADGSFNNCVQPSKYAEFLIQTSTAAHAQSSSVNIIFGGLAFPYGMGYEEFLSQAYTVPNLYSSYASLAIHPYDFDPAHTNGDKNINGVTSKISGVRSYLNTLTWGSSRSLWIGELGWPMNDFGDKNFSQVKDEAEQARLLTESFDWIKSEASSKNIIAAVWYNIRDLSISNWAYACGLRDINGKYRQSWYAFQKETGATHWPRSRADFDGDGRTDYAVWRPTATGKFYVDPASGASGFTHTYGGAGDIPLAGDFDGDGRTDYAVWRPSTGTFYVDPASGASGFTHTLGGSGDIPLAGDFDGDGRTDYAVWRPSTGTFYVDPASGASGFTHTLGGSGDIPLAGDFDGDGRTDYAVWRPSTGTFYVDPASGASGFTHTLGGSGDIPLAGDFDGDGRTDYAVWRPSTGKFYVDPASGASGFTHTLGGSGDIPQPGDFDGDGRTDYAVWRPSTGTFYVDPASGASGFTHTLGGSGDIPLAGDFDSDRRADFDGDGRTDFAVWRPTATGKFYVDPASGASGFTHTYGGSGDIPLPGDFDGDGRTDYAVWRPSNGTFYVDPASGASGFTHTLGASGDIPLPGDFDGDGRTDYAVWRPSNGTFYVDPASGASGFTHTLGASGDIPLAGNFDGDRRTDYAVWRPSTGKFYVDPASGASGFSHTLGAAGDIPLPGDFDGDGRTDYAVWRPSNGTFYVDPASGASGFTHTLGASGDIPLAGNFDGDRRTDYAVWRPSTGKFYVDPASGASGFSHTLGGSGDIPLP